MDRFSNTEQAEINEINITDPVVLETLLCAQVNRVCSPESFFEMIETCKICGKCV